MRQINDRVHYIIMSGPEDESNAFSIRKQMVEVFSRDVWGDAMIQMLDYQLSPLYFSERNLFHAFSRPA